MLKIMMERLMIFTINIFCPPVSVMLVAGPGMDCILNTLFFIAGVIPGHIHAFYITYTYFHRKRKVSKGRYPGGRKRGIYSEQVWNGGASNAKVRELHLRQRAEEELNMPKQVSKRSSGMNSKRGSGLERMGSESTSTGYGGSDRCPGYGDQARRSVRRSNTTGYLYDGEERRPVERTISVNGKQMRDERDWRM